MGARKKRVVALGFFDGVHMGHSALLARAKEQAALLGATPSVLTFDPHPRQFTTGERVPLINTLSDRVELIQRLHGIDDLLVIPFSEALRRMPWPEFLVLLQKKFHAVHLVCGHDFQFGYGGAGHSEELREKCAQLGIGCDVIPEISLDGVPVSATHIRRLLMAGDMAQANRFLGRPHILTERVVHGHKLGQTIGVPTINMHVPQEVLTPAHGVYVSRVFLPDEQEGHMAITNIGVRPTLEEANPVIVESHILAFDADLYNRQVRVEFYHFLRPERKFQNMRELKAQILRDIDGARAYFSVSG